MFHPGFVAGLIHIMIFLAAVIVHNYAVLFPDLEIFEFLRLMQPFIKLPQNIPVLRFGLQFLFHVLKEAVGQDAVFPILKYAVVFLVSVLHSACQPFRTQDKCYADGAGKNGEQDNAGLFSDIKPEFVYTVGHL